MPLTKKRRKPSPHENSPARFPTPEKPPPPFLAPFSPPLTQVQKTNIEGLAITDVVRSTAVFRGIQGRVPLAEAFVPLRLFINVLPSGREGL